MCPETHSAIRKSSEQRSGKPSRPLPQISSMTDYPSLPQRKASTGHGLLREPTTSTRTDNAVVKEADATKEDSNAADTQPSNYGQDNNSEILLSSDEESNAVATQTDAEAPATNHPVLPGSPQRTDGNNADSAVYPGVISQDLFGSVTHEHCSPPTQSVWTPSGHDDLANEMLFDAESQTFVKQRFVPKEATRDSANQFVVPQNGEQCNVDTKDNAAVSTDKDVLSESFISIENELPRATSTGPQTRSKVKSRQTQLTETYKSTPKNTDARPNAT